MVDYPDNYKKPSMTDYLAQQVVESNQEPQDWDLCDLGEVLAAEFDQCVKNFKLTDSEYENLIKGFENFIADYIGEELEAAVVKKIKEGEANYREYREVIEERN